MNLTIRNAETEDLNAILGVYDTARAYMRANGNMNQWINGYPQPELLREDIAARQLYVCAADHICGAFAFITGDDPTYAYIEDGAWKNRNPYGAIHRLGSDGTYKGLFGACLGFCLARCPDIRADTHADNLTMQHVLEKHGFLYCGRIYIEDGSARAAYQYCG